MKHTRQQIEDAIASWYLYMLENKMMTKLEAKQELLGESWFKRAKAAVKGGFSKAGSAIASAAKGIARSVHDFFAANKGVKEMMSAISKMLKDKVSSKDIKLYVQVKGTSQAYPVSQFVFSKDRKVLALLFNKRSNEKKTYYDLFDAMSENGIKGAKTQLSDFVDCLVVGEVVGNKTYLNESINDNDKERIAGVVKGLKWKYKTATDNRQIKKLMTFLGIKDNDFDEVKTYIKNAYSMQSDDEEDREVGHPRKDQDNFDKKSDKEDMLQKVVLQLEGTPNDVPLEAKDGYVGVMDCPFLDVRTNDSKHIVCVFFDKKKSDVEREKAEQQAMG